MMKKSWLGAGLVILALAFSASHLPAQEKILKIGVMAPYTGPQADNGKELRLSAEMALENINYKIGDYKLEVVWIDDQCEPAQATGAYIEAAEKHKIDVSAMSWCSSVAVATMELAAEYKIPHICGFGAAELVNEKYHSDPEKYSYWANKGWPIPAKLMQGYVEAVEAAIAKGDWKPEKKTIAVYGEDTDWGRSAGGFLKRIFSEAGWEVVSEDYFLNTQIDFYSLLNRYRSHKVALIAGASQYPATGILIKQAREIGLESLIIADGMGWIGNWFEQTGAAGEGVLDMIPQIATPAAKAWAEKFEARAGFKPSPAAAGLAYEAANIMIKILNRTFEKHGRLDKETIHEVLKSEWLTGEMDYTKADGAIIMNAFRYTPETVPDPVVGPESYFFPVLQFDRDGAGHVIYPPDIAVRSLKAP
jgi:branched-chain amino acid transport system substrate-binding protein